jgi:serine/threonine protein kinase
VLSSSPQVLSSFKGEVSILAQLRHPNVVLYIGACTRPPNVFIVTEWCERGGLNDLLYDHTKPICAEALVDFALQTAKGMCYLHRYD